MEKTAPEAAGVKWVIDTEWYAKYNRSFLELARRQQVVSVVSDQCGCPTFTDDLAGALVDLIRSRAYGIYHVTNSGSATWYELACTAVQLAGVPARVEPVATSAFPRPAPRPRNSVLDPFPLPQVLGHPLPGWRDALRYYVRNCLPERIAMD